MDDLWLRIAACVACTGFFFAGSLKMFGALQQSGYRGSGFFRWLKNKENLYYNRIVLWTTMSVLLAAFFSVCFSFAGARLASGISLAPLLFISLLFFLADRKYALKVPLKVTGRIKRLAAVYVFFLAAIGFFFLSLLEFGASVIDKPLIHCFKFAPFAFFPLLLPFIFALSNAVSSPFENARNGKFVKRAGQVLNESNIIRVAVVGSYGKTSVKNILKTLLSEKYSVIATPHSFNTPIGIAKTVLNGEFAGKEVLIAEMGARRIGDIEELCALVKPDYALFTGVCAQHVESFGSEGNVFKGKCEILRGTNGTVVCGGGLEPHIMGAEFLSEEEKAKCAFVPFDGLIRNLRLGATETEFDFLLSSGTVHVKTKLLGRHSAENIALAAYLAEKMGLTAVEIERAAAKLAPTAHRLELSENGGVYILDDSYNSNPRGAKEAIEALRRFNGRKFVVTPGLVETGILEEKISRELGAQLVGLDSVVLVGGTLVAPVKAGYLEAGGDGEKLRILPTLEDAQGYLETALSLGDAVLFLNDLPDAY
ncbi:MAG: UDP-N-acetylmuramoyl-tripeptide--D-alanyl-D-alanine ligase [Clostridia bacterium]|nr:UDP-N-acetylmuramoyl-tripeptide--D-alanyl-D-alanine ligase [Clostridia bacterium]